MSKIKNKLCVNINIGERTSIIYPNGLAGIGTVQKYLPPDGDDEALFHILHDDGDKKNLDGYECFAAMEQYRKKLLNFGFKFSFCATP